MQYGANYLSFFLSQALVKVRKSHKILTPNHMPNKSYAQ